jgi:hypothetical protein
MTIKLITFDQLENKQLFFDFCKSASTDLSDPASVNMWHDQWNNASYSLPYLLLIKRRFLSPNGEFYLIQDGNIIVGCSGIYISDFSKNIAIAGCRTWISKNYRNKSLVREYFLPIEKEWALKQNCKIIALTFNQYNKNIIQIWKRNRLGEHRTPRASKHLFFNNFNELSYLINVQNTPQWIIYEQLDLNFNFDWQSIESKK